VLEATVANGLEDLGLQHKVVEAAAVQGAECTLGLRDKFSVRAARV
jgi:hypothetical protein